MSKVFIDPNSEIILMTITALKTKGYIYLGKISTLNKFDKKRKRQKDRSCCNGQYHHNNRKRLIYRSLPNWRR